MAPLSPSLPQSTTVMYNSMKSVTMTLELNFHRLKLNHLENRCISGVQVICLLVFHQVTSTFGQLGWTSSSTLDTYRFTTEGILEWPFLHLRVATNRAGKLLYRCQNYCVQLLFIIHKVCHCIDLLLVIVISAEPLSA